MRPLADLALQRRALDAARRWKRRLKNPEVEHARLLRKRLESESVDIVHLGASESLFVSPSDQDQRTLQRMLVDAWAPDLTTASIAGAGYNPRLFKEYLKIVSNSSSHPIVVVALCARFGCAPWAEHPVYSYRRATKALARIKPGAPSWRIRSYVPLPTAAEFVVLDEIDYATIIGTRKVGDFRHGLTRPVGEVLSERERLRTLFSYHHGAVEDLNEEFLRQVTSLGQQLKNQGMLVVPYHTPFPYVRGTELLGHDLELHLRRHLDELEAAFVSGYGPVEFVQSGMAFDSPEFIDPDDATEHINEHGRLHLAQMITDQVRKIQP